MKKVLVMFIVLTGAVLNAAATEPAPTPAAAFDGSAPGGRQTALGQAFTAGSADAACVYYNPAGLADNAVNVLSITYEPTRQSELSTNDIFASETIKNRNFLFVALTGPKFAISWRPLANTTVRTSTGTDWQEDDIKVNAFTISTSHKHSDVLSSGLNLTYMTGQIGHSSLLAGVPALRLSDGYGLSLDYGLQFILGEQFRFGVNFKNIAGTMWWENYEKEQLPFTLRTGIAYNIANFMIFSADWETRYYRKQDKADLAHYGLEQALGNALRLRAGIWGDDLNNKETVHVTAGIGYLANNYDLSLAGEKYRLLETDVVRYVLSVNIPM